MPLNAFTFTILTCRSGHIFFQDLEDEGVKHRPFIN